MASPITQDDILEAIRLALQFSPETGDGLTVPELAVKMSPPLGEQTVRRGIKRLLAEGGMETCRVRRRRMDGVMTWVSAYRLIA